MPNGRSRSTSASNFFFRAGDFDDHRVRRQIHHARAKNAHDFHQAVARFFASFHFNQRQAASDGGNVRHVFDREHVDQLVDIGFDAMRGAFADPRDDGHARDAGAFGVADGERFDVVSAAAKQRGDAIQHAGLVFDVKDEDVQLCRFQSSEPFSTSGFGRRIMACKSAPAGHHGIDGVFLLDVEIDQRGARIISRGFERGTNFGARA